MNGIRIRKMTPEDIPEVAALGREIFSEPWTERGFAYALEPEANVFLVAEGYDGHIAGYCGTYVLGDEGEISNVAVSGEDRRNGIADAMLAELMGILTWRGVSQIYLEVRASNEAAIRLYQKHGFVPCGMRREFYRFPTEDALLMCYESEEIVRT